jgi:hypothetical protein
MRRALASVSYAVRFVLPPNNAVVYVHTQIGNIFSGLYLSVRNTSTVAAAGLTAIRRPGEAAFEAHVPGLLTGTGTQQSFTAGSNTVGSTTSSSSGTVSGGVRGAGLGSTSQRVRWCQEAYLQDKLRDGAAAVKVSVRREVRLPDGCAAAHTVCVLDCKRVCAQLWLCPDCC